METNFAKGKESCNLEKKIFVLCSFLLLNIHLIEGQKVRNVKVTDKVCFDTSKLFCADKFEGVSPNGVECSIFFSLTLTLIL